MNIWLTIKFFTTKIIFINQSLIILAKFLYVLFVVTVLFKKYQKTLFLY